MVSTSFVGYNIDEFKSFFYIYFSKKLYLVYRISL